MGKDKNFGKKRIKDMAIPKSSLIFMVLCVIFLLLSIPSGAALSEINMDRKIIGNASKDTEAILKLEGFNHDCYCIGEEYTATGTITNNTYMSMNLTVTLTSFGPFEENSWYIIKIGDEVCQFMKEADLKTQTPSFKQMTLSLAPGEIMDVLSAMSANVNDILEIEIGITAADRAGTFVLELNHTPVTPRKFYCYYKGKKKKMIKELLQYEKTEDLIDQHEFIDNEEDVSEDDVNRYIKPDNKQEGAGDEPCS
jgi:hypothetical protein